MFDYILDKGTIPSGRVGSGQVVESYIVKIVRNWHKLRFGAGKKFEHSVIVEGFDYVMLLCTHR